MPAKTPMKKKPAAKSASRSSSAKPKTNGVSKAKHNGAEAAALRADFDKLKVDAAGAQEKIAQLEMQIVNDGDQLRAVQAKLTASEADAQAARSEAHNLRDALNKSKPPLAAGQLRCPRCAGVMAEFQVETVRADRCDACHGIFFKNGDVEMVLKHHDEHARAGSKNWFSGLFGRK